MLNKPRLPTERYFNLDGLELAAQQWGEETDTPVMALHGWLDNSASFSSLAPALPGTNLVALDLAGHGMSGHRPGSTPYNIWEDVAEIFGLADQLGWERFSLIGHSRGAIISLLAAGTFPERIARLGLVEGFWPDPHEISDAPEQLAKSISEGRRLARKPLTSYDSIEDAARARARGMFPLSSESARVLTERGVRSTETGYCWSTDQRLLAPSAVKLTKAHVEAFIARIEAPIKLILGKDGLMKLFPPFLESVKAFPQVDIEVMAGGHHLHMEEQAESVAKILMSFLHEENVSTKKMGR